MACQTCLNVRLFLLPAAPLLVMGLVDPVLTDRLLSNLPDLRQLVLWFPAVIAGTFLYRYLSWRRANRLPDEGQPTPPAVPADPPAA